MQLTRKYPGGALNFFQMFQITYINLDNDTQTDLSNKEKIGQLNAALHNGNFQNFCTTCETSELMTGNPLDYTNYLQSMITNYDNIRNYTRKNNRTENYGVGRVSGDKRGDDDTEWKKYMTDFFPYKIYSKMSSAEKSKREADKQVSKESK